MRKRKKTIYLSDLPNYQPCKIFGYFLNKTSKRWMVKIYV